jgi:hypothetical protein
LPAGTAADPRIIRAFVRLRELLATSKDLPPRRSNGHIGYHGAMEKLPAFLNKLSTDCLAHVR